MPEPRWTLLVHSGSPGDGDACLAAARAGAVVLRYGGGAVQAVEAALRSFRRGSGEDVDAPLDGLITDGRTLRRSSGEGSAGEGRWGAVALAGEGHLAAGGWGDAHADDAAGAASVLGGPAAGRIVQALEEGVETRSAAAMAGASAVVVDRRGRIGLAPGDGALAMADNGSEPRLMGSRELLDG